jgi:STE24 endopeptidase
MHLQVVMAFALLLWWPNGAAERAWLTARTPVLLVVWGTPVLIAILAQCLSLVTRIRMQRPGGMARALTFYHRGALVLRLGALVGLATHLLATAWPAMLVEAPVIGDVPGLSQLALLVPYLLSLTALWWMTYPIEQASRFGQAVQFNGGVRSTTKSDGLRGATRSERTPARSRLEGPASSARASSAARPLNLTPFLRPLSRWRFCLFNLRHQVFVVAMPLSIIVIAYAATRDHAAWLVSLTRSKWAPDVLLGSVAVATFIFSPLILRRVWATSRLPDGPLRRKLLGLCQRIGLRVREILVWHSDGMMVNAAVMGLFPRVRYILLSDTLLESMTDEEIEAVFGHEAGHVRHHHIPYFLLFALISMLVAAGVIELLARTCRGPGAAWLLSDDVIQMIGIAAIIPLWGIGFGWVSRRFERQADVFGAKCASPGGGNGVCRLPCPVHDGPPPANAQALCATGAQVFVQALQKVALLNGIPPAERSWRHSSIASRIRFLTVVGGDPMMARRFSHCVRGVKVALVLLSATGLTLATVYLWQNPGYRQEIINGVLVPLQGLVR